MIPRETALKILELWQDNPSPAEVGRLTKVSPSTVRSVVARPTRYINQRDRPDPVPSSSPNGGEYEFCEGCEHSVKLPCVYCAAVAWKREHGKATVAG